MDHCIAINAARDRFLPFAAEANPDVGEPAIFIAEICIGHVVVGSIRGVRVTLQAQSHVEGDITHQSLAIEQGAYFEGKSRRTDNPLEEVKASSAGSPRPVHKPSAKPHDEASAPRAAE